MTTLKPIPPIAVVQAVARNGAQYRNVNPQYMRHAFAIRGHNLPHVGTKKAPNDKHSVDLYAIKSLFSEVEQKHQQFRFEVSDSPESVLVSVIDRQTGELIQRISGESAIETAEQLKSIEPGEIKAGTFLSSEI